MTKPSDFSPSKALEVKNKDAAKESDHARWVLRAVGAGVLIFGWLAIGLDDIGHEMFVVDTVVFLAMAIYAFTAAAASRRHAVSREKKLRLRLLVHNMELENMSIRDELTQLFNRRYVMERLERELHTAKGFQRPLAFIAIKVKSLNHINHTYGYAVGDQVIAAFGRFLLDYTRATDIPARISGNKFGVILPDTSKRGACAMVERLTQALASTQLVEDPRLSSVIVQSFGMSGYPWGGDTLDAIVRQAEVEMASSSSAEDNGGECSDESGEQPLGIPAIFQKPDGEPGAS